MIANLFVFISTSNFSNSSGQTPRYHPWFLYFFHTSLPLYPQFLLILPPEHCHYSSTSLSPYYHPGPGTRHCLSLPAFYLVSCFSPCPLQSVLNPGDTPRIMPVSAQESPYISSFSLRMKGHVFFSVICRTCMIWVYGYFLYMFSRGLISNTTLSWLHSS